MDDCLHSLGATTLSLTLDYNSGKSQVPIAPKYRDKTGHITRSFVLVHTNAVRMENVPGTFQPVERILLARVNWKFSVVYLEDIIPYSASVGYNYAHLRHVLHILSHSSLTLRYAKYYLGHESEDLLASGIQPGRDVVAVNELDSIEPDLPRGMQTAVRALLGVSNFSQRFAPQLWQVVRPLDCKQ